MTKRSKADRKRIKRTPSSGPPTVIVRDDYVLLPQGAEPAWVYFPVPEPTGCMNGGRFQNCDCLVCVRRRAEKERKDG